MHFILRNETIKKNIQKFQYCSDMIKDGSMSADLSEKVLQKKSLKWSKLHSKEHCN